MILAVRKAIAPSFIAAMFASAALLFLLQPIFARLTTPLLGGSPAVWNTSMVFFQAALLLGYAYAHGLARVSALRTQIVVHACVLAAALAALVLVGDGPRLAVASLFGPPNPSTPILWLLGTLTVSIGLPFAAMSATAPLLQSWYARSGRHDAHDPYYLYAASNLGSLLGLGAYPVLIEPTLGLTLQTAVWGGGFILAGAGVVAAGLLTLRAGATAAATEAVREEAPRVSWGDRAYWAAAAAVPSSLILGVTSHISTDVASAPFLWVIPLALYLLTFVIAFARSSDGIRPYVALLQTVSMAILIVAFAQNDFWITLVASLTTFFLSSLVCHMALAARRPPATRLTEFYMWVSIGGVLGGAATALLAPVLFSDVYEYPLALAAAGLFLTRNERPLPIIVAALLIVAAVLFAGQRLFDGVTVLDAFQSGVGGEVARTALSKQAPNALGVVAIALLTVAASGGDRIARWASLCLSAGCAAAAIALIIAAVQGDGINRNDIVAAVALGASAALILLGRRRDLMREVTLIFGATAFVAVAFVALGRMGVFQNAGDLPKFTFSSGLLFAVLGILAAALVANRARPLIAGGVVLAAFAAVYLNQAERNIVFQGRSFFGVTRVVEHRNIYADGPLRVMMHGTTIHGAQYVGGARATDPLTYYHPDTGLGSAILAGIAQHPVARVGVIGLGTGSTACLLRPQDSLTVFEIDPMVVDFSITQGVNGVFSFVPRCAPQAKVVLGDARLGVAQLPDANFDVLVVDAFSSDAVPAHLLTREAISLYLRKLSPHGVAVLHLSNRNLDLVAEASRVTRAGGWGGRWATLEGGPSTDSYTSFATSVFVVGRTQAEVDRLELGAAWSPPQNLPGRAWSDEYINLVRPLLDQAR